MEEEAKTYRDDMRWDLLFSQSTGHLERLAVRALQDYRSQKTQPIDDLIDGCDNKIFEGE